MASLTDSLKYVGHRIRGSDAWSLGFLDMGLGIVERHAKHRPFWQAHLEACQREQAAWSKNTQPPAQLAVYGAGRLYDLALDALTPTFSRIELIDADPLVKPRWKSAQRAFPSCTITETITECSGVLSSWSDAFSTAVAACSNDAADGFSAALAALEQIELPATAKHYCPAQANAVLSLNILSQIPIMWQDCVERILLNHFDSAIVIGHTAQWLRALQHSAKALVEQHLRALAATKATTLLLLTDVEIFEYQDISSLTPTSFKLGENGLHTNNCECKTITSYPALYGFSLEEAGELEQLWEEYEVSRGATWLWHIAPARNSIGSVHRVRAVTGMRKTA